MLPVTHDYVTAYQAERRADAARYRRARTVEFEGQVFEVDVATRRLDVGSLWQRLAAWLNRPEAVGSQL